MVENGTYVFTDEETGALIIYMFEGGSTALSRDSGPMPPGGYQLDTVVVSARSASFDPYALGYTTGGDEGGGLGRNRGLVGGAGRGGNNSVANAGGSGSSGQNSTSRPATGSGATLVVNSDTNTVVSQDVIPYARSITVGFELKGLPPLTAMYLYCNSTIKLSSYVTPTGGSLGGSVITDSHGSATGSFLIPNTSTLKIPTGKILFSFGDNSEELAKSYAYAEASFTAHGTINTEQREIVSPREPEVIRPTVEDPWANWNWGDSSDPLAQTFTVSDTVYPNGLFLSSVDLFFAKKDTTLPVFVQLRPTVNGTPSSTVVLPFSQVFKNPADVFVPDIDEIQNGIGPATKFTFKAPVYLRPGEYALIVGSQVNTYELYASELGQFELGTTNRILTQPFMGSLFKSQNASTWTPTQFEDLCFRLNQCKFNRGNVNFQLNMNPTSESTYDLVRLTTQELNFGNLTDIKYSLKSKYRGSNVITDFYSIPSSSNYEMQSTMVASSNADGALKVTMVNQDENISPVVDLDRVSTIVVANDIDAATTTITDSELLASGGYARAKYITRRVTLASGFDATGLNVSVLVNRRQGTDIKVYYKVLNKYDSTSFDNRTYVEMSRTTLSGDVIFTNSPNSYSEENYQALDIKYNYGSSVYDDFKVFAIKIVFFTTNQSIVPKIKALRVTAVS